jgi:hypothetical protein
VNAGHAIFRAAFVILVAYIVFALCGLLVLRLLGVRERGRVILPVAPWVGWAAAVVFLQGWHTFAPVNACALVVVLAVGLAGSVLEWKRLAKLFRMVGWPAFVTLLLAGVALAGWLANHSVRQPDIYDSGLYHLNAIRWHRAYAVVPGLVNLHWRLAFNNNSHLYAALLDAGPLARRSHHVASASLMFMASVQAMIGFLGVWRRRPCQVEDLYWAFCAVPLLIWCAVSGYASSPSPDVPVFLLQLVIGGLLVRAILQDDTSRLSGAYRTVVLLGAVGITVKLSMAAFSVAACTVLLVELARRRGLLAVPWRDLGFGAGLVGLVLGPWMLRGIILSGFPLFPATLLPVDLDWAFPVDAARAGVERIKAWARIPGMPPESVLGSWNWFGTWFVHACKNQVLVFTAPLLALCVGSCLAVFSWTRRKRRPILPVWPLLLVPVVGLAHWFVSAPDPRFQGAQLWVLAAMVLASAGHRLTPWLSRGLLVLAALLLLGVVRDPVRFVWNWHDPTPARRVDMESRKTLSGLRVLVPREGDQAWDSDLPSTPYFNPRLRLRVTGDMSKGFTKRPPEKNEGSRY